MQPYLATVGQYFEPSPKENLFDIMFKQYEQVIVESIVTSFGLDFLISDQHGGDVDTILNVRKIGIDPQMQYKNQKNQEAYQDRGLYNYEQYHGKNKEYASLKRDAKKNFQNTGTPITDAYTGKDLYFQSRGAAKGNADKQASIDHVLSASTIHNDRGRVLAGLSGEDLANSKENLVFTNAALNSSMGATKNEWKEVVEIPEYIQKHPELPEETKANMMREYNRAKSAYDAKVQRTYYTSPKFAKDLGKAAANVGVRMGIRQAFGFIFVEIWFSVKTKLQQIEDPFSMEKLLRSIGDGIKCGVKSAKEKYRDLIGKFGEGIVSGALSSLTTTLCNIFFTTAKNTVCIIRQSWASLVQAMEIILFNPNDLLFGDRLCAAVKILSVGGSVIIGTTVREMIAKTPAGSLPIVGEIIQSFSGSFVSGIMSCTLLCFLDRSKKIQALIQKLNQIPTIEKNISIFQQYAKFFECYAAELEKIDLEQFQKECRTYSQVLQGIDKIQSEQELTVFLKDVFKQNQIPYPWQGDFNNFMSNKENHLVFQ